MRKHIHAACLGEAWCSTLVVHTSTHWNLDHQAKAGQIHIQCNHMFLSPYCICFFSFHIEVEEISQSGRTSVLVCTDFSVAPCALSSLQTETTRWCSWAGGGGEKGVAEAGSGDQQRVAPTRIHSPLHGVGLRTPLAKALWFTKPTAYMNCDPCST